ncbi:hypothetical protein MB84_07120 [Pandoraea oxalativorans]|uniref:Phosphoribosyltransferase domain-containing protein n=1 Tax=Pandoraea oxalativorans TaxID=573737 RepID=A0A0E3YEY8_9BURK|nr:hypothetical protein MB84_07120 [Pandoraea oxalativorans]
MLSSLFQTPARLASGLLRIALPDHCAICRRRAPRQICDACATSFDASPPHARPRCARCAVVLLPPVLALDGTVAPLGNSATICRTPTSALCGQRLQTQPAFDATLTLADYVTPLDMLMIRLKYRGALPLAREFGERLGDALRDVVPAGCDRDTVPLVVPVPLAPSRLTSRGFNQAWELARVAARRARLPASAGILHRERTTLAQRRLSRDARQRNLRDVFVASERIKGRHVVLIDDVMTTGATCNAAATALKRAGAAHVLAAVVLRTPPSTHSIN